MLLLQPKSPILRYNKFMKNMTYRQLTAELDTILSEMQSGELDIDQAVGLYQRGMEIVGQLSSQLKTAENKITKIKHSFDQK